MCVHKRRRVPHEAANKRRWRCVCVNTVKMCKYFERARDSIRDRPHIASVPRFYRDTLETGTKTATMQNAVPNECFPISHRKRRRRWWRRRRQSFLYKWRKTSTVSCEHVFCGRLASETSNRKMFCSSCGTAGGALYQDVHLPGGFACSGGSEEQCKENVQFVVQNVAFMM